MHSERLHSSFHWSGGSLKKEKSLFWGRRNFPSFLVSHVCSSPQQILTRLVTAVMGSLNHGKSVKRLIQLSHRHQKRLFVFVEMSFKYQKSHKLFMISTEIKQSQQLQINFQSGFITAAIYYSINTPHQRARRIWEPGHTHTQTADHTPWIYS